MTQKRTKRIGGNHSGISQTEKRPDASDAGLSLCLSFVSSPFLLLPGKAFTTASTETHTQNESLSNELHGEKKYEEV